MSNPGGPGLPGRGVRQPGCANRAPCKEQTDQRAGAKAVAAKPGHRAAHRAPENGSQHGPLPLEGRNWRPTARGAVCGGLQYLVAAAHDRQEENVLLAAHLFASLRAGRPMVKLVEDTAHLGAVHISQVGRMHVCYDQDRPLSERTCAEPLWARHLLEFPLLALFRFLQSLPADLTYVADQSSQVQPTPRRLEPVNRALAPR